MKTKSKRVLAFSLCFVTLSVMLFSMVSQASATTPNLPVDELNTMSLPIGGFRQNYLYCNEPIFQISNNQWRYIQVGCNNAASESYYCIVSGIYTGNTQQRTFSLHVYVHGMGSTLTGSTAQAKYYITFTDDTGGSVLLTNHNYNWTPIAAGDGWLTVTWTGTAYNGHTYELGVGPYAATNNAADTSLVWGTIQELSISYT